MRSYSVFAGFYDVLTDNVAYPVRAEYLYGLFSRFGVRHGLLLDLACGTGSLSVELARRGFEVIGVDNSPEMLAVAAEKAAEQGQDILFLCQNMQQLDLYGTIDAAVCTLDSLNHITRPREVQAVLQRVSLFMNPGGIFIFDVNTPYKHREILGNQTFVYDLDNVYCVWQNEYASQTQAVSISLDFFIRGKDNIYVREREFFIERAYSREEWKQWIQAAGFELLGEYAELTESAPKENTQRIIYVVRKAG